MKPRNALFGLLSQGLNVRLNRYDIFIDGCYISPDRYNILPGGHIDSVVPERKNLPLDEKLSLPFGKVAISAQELYQAVRVICEVLYSWAVHMRVPIPLRVLLPWAVHMRVPDSWAGLYYFSQCINGVLVHRI